MARITRRGRIPIAPGILNTRGAHTMYRDTLHRGWMTLRGSKPPFKRKRHWSLRMLLYPYCILVGHTREVKETDFAAGGINRRATLHHCMCSRCYHTVIELTHYWDG